MKKLICVDLDNTIVKYDELFHNLALEYKLIPNSTPVSKEHVRDFLRAVGKEKDWTILQGIVYGQFMLDAKPFPGAKNFFRKCKLDSVEVHIVSHRTKYPFLGPRNNLHKAAYNWLEKYGLYNSPNSLHSSEIHLEITKEDKLNRLASLGCTEVIDDLPEFLNEVKLPENVNRILFDPEDRHQSQDSFERVGSWSELESSLLGSPTSRTN